MQRALSAILFMAAAVVLGWILAYAFWLFTVVVLGETECDRGECGFWGELVDDHRWTIVLGFAAISAVALWPRVRHRLKGRPNH
jgi:hypothetical protein